MLTRKTVLLAGKETTYGTDPAMTGSNGLLAWDVDVDITGDVLERPILRDSLSPLPHVIGMKYCSLKFKTEIKGIGLTGTVPTPNSDNGLLYQGCGYNSGVNTGTTLKFSLVSDESSVGSISFIVEIDGNWHKILGSKGNMKPVMEAGKYGYYDWEFQGIYDPVSAATVHDVAGLSENKPPICYNASFQIGGFSPVSSKAEIDIGNQIAKRDDLNATYGVRGFRITSRKGKFNFDADAVVESSNPFWGDWEGNVVDTFGIQVGSSSGNIVKFNGFFQYEQPKYGDQDGVRKYECTASLCSSDSSTQNDELTITHI